ncbi:maltase-glucoamylase, intestinal-like [Grus japonensis]|uniref:Maltase-glucoamylase, intestinal-like n=1 Tax=Grus japonensis TaxID=30415 RepID=A0ABC9XVF4_GRUJA
MGLIIALDDNNEAVGELFWDDGESTGTVSSKSYISYDFKVSNNVLQMNVTNNNYVDPNQLVFEEIKILGLVQELASVTVLQNNDIQASPHNITYDPVNKVAVIQGLRLELGKSYSLRWTLGTSINERYDCHPSPNASKEKCEQLGCVWTFKTITPCPITTLKKSPSPSVL